MNFFMPMRPPTVTHHDKQLHAYMKDGKPCAVLHDTPELKAARAKLHAALAPFAPAQPMTGAVQLVVQNGCSRPRDARTAAGKPRSPTPTIWKRP